MHTGNIQYKTKFNDGIEMKLSAKWGGEVEMESSCLPVSAGEEMLKLEVEKVTLAEIKNEIWTNVSNGNA